ncbi:MAG: prolipoprotein diacylglyceryl transferase family protein [Tepidisphaeraceae bacterium]
MKFPVFFHFFGRSFDAHLVMELIGYLIAYALYMVLRERSKRPVLPAEVNIWVIAGCLLGAAAGSKILAIADSFHTYWAFRHDLQFYLGGKTIVGGLAGGWIGVEIVKREFGIRQKTGDLFVFPIIVGTCFGRVGCFLEGLEDHTYGIATNLPWGVDFGDGVRRHPTQLYEIVFLILLAIALLIRMRKPRRDGDLFLWFAMSYFAWRLAVDFIKPQDPRDLWLGISPIQWVCIAGVLAALYNLKKPTPIIKQEPTDAGSSLPVL